MACNSNVEALDITLYHLHYPIPANVYICMSKSIVAKSHGRHLASQD